jgi:hypothetical protein
LVVPSSLPSLDALPSGGGRRASIYGLEEKNAMRRIPATRKASIAGESIKIEPWRSGCGDVNDLVGTSAAEEPSRREV